jgi:hypothetical protein
MAKYILKRRNFEVISLHKDSPEFFFEKDTVKYVTLYNECECRKISYLFCFLLFLLETFVFNFVISLILQPKEQKYNLTLKKFIIEEKNGFLKYENI